MRFAEFHAGLTLHAGPYTVTEQEIIEFARRYDPQWFHTDPQAARAGRWGGLIASGWLTCGIAMRLACEVALEGSESYASPGLDHLKWLLPVRPGDALTLHATVLETRRSASNPSLGILKWQWRVTNQRDEAVLDVVATSFFDLSNADASATSSIVSAATETGSRRR